MALTEAEVGFMELAFKAAEEALSKQEVPVGCIFVLNGEVIATGRNRVNETKNACLHAEFVCVDDVLTSHGREVLKEVDVYVTVEPCIMCAAMLSQIGVRKVVYGATNERFGGLGGVVNVILEEGKLQVVPGIQAERAVQLLKEFYAGENPNAPQPKMKRKEKPSNS